ncbi:MAG: tRNA (guanosine(46)-N7)-methyltransferase TrmB, partial [Magnetococcales bacterium]|nr:tRNA (guanosine(46)-N7)-methyltransferase TrmB [Magnetococcales bacterium]
LTQVQRAQLEETLSRYHLEPRSERETFLRQWGRAATSGMLWVEIGFGNGDYLAHIAERHPQDAMVGVEVFLEGIASLTRKLDLAGRHNVRVVRGHAHPILRDMLPDNAIDRVIVNFPDPWPKKRHHKRRLIQPEFLDLLAMKIRPGGRLTLATDWQEYAAWMETILGAHPAFVGGPSPPPEEWIVTRFQQKGHQAGRPALHLAYERRLD